MSRNVRFHQILREYGIDEFSPTIPQGVGRHLQGVVYEDDLHKIPFSNEEAIVFTEHKTEKLTPEEMKAQYTQAELKIIASEIENQKLDYTNIQGKELDIPGEFPSVSTFVHFKRELATQIAKENEEMGLEPGCFSICKVPQCLNSTVPGFDYCLTHLSKDDNFDKVKKFIHKCGKNDCTTPCSSNQEFCPIHRMPGK